MATEKGGEDGRRSVQSKSLTRSTCLAGRPWSKELGVPSPRRDPAATSAAERQRSSLSASSAGLLRCSPGILETNMFPPPPPGAGEEKTLAYHQ
jgi:hypothetical protein